MINFKEVFCFWTKVNLIVKYLGGRKNDSDETFLSHLFKLQIAIKDINSLNIAIVLNFEYREMRRIKSIIKFEIN